MKKEAPFIKFIETDTYLESLTEAEWIIYLTEVQMNLI